MKEEPLTAEESLALLRENASRLAALTDGLPSERLHTAPQPRRVVPERRPGAHSRVLRRLGGNIARILADEHLTFAGMNPRTWMKKTDYPEWPFEAAFSGFSAQREELLSTLNALTPDDWERTATVTSYGQANERTVRLYTSQLAKHERAHVRQIERTLTGKPSRISSIRTPEGAT